MEKKYTFTLPPQAEKIFDKAQAKAEEHKVSFSGNMDSGTFSGKGFEGSYQVISGEIIFKIRKKPFMVPWTLIENSLQKVFK